MYKKPIITALVPFWLSSILFLQQHTYSGGFKAMEREVRAKGGGVSY